MAETKTAIKSSCHCGAITLTVPRLPDFINECKCTICRRYGAGWAYYHPDEVKFDMKPGAETGKYIWGDRDLSFDHCKDCGCVCYWWPLQDPKTDNREYKMGVNTNNMDPEVLKYVDRRLEYSMLVAQVRNKETAHPDDVAKY